MTREDARNFIVALNAIAPYVPPMLMNGVTQNPISQIIQQMANAPEQGVGEQGTAAERPKPHAVS